MKETTGGIRSMIRRNRVRLVCIGFVVTLVVIFLWPSVVISIRSGELGVLYSRFGGGTVLEKAYGEGLHIIFPWDIMYIYDVRMQEETQRIDVITGDGLTLSTQISLRFQIIRDALPVLHQQIGPNYREKIIIPIMNAAVRQAVGNYKPEDLYYSARRELQEQMFAEAVAEIRQIPIRIDGFAVKSITLPGMLRDAIELKVIAKQNFMRYRYLLLTEQQEAKRKTIEGEGIQAYQNLVNKNMTPDYLRFEGIKATKELAASPNAKIVVVGGKDGLPIILNTEQAPAPALPPPGTPGDALLPVERPEPPAAEAPPPTPPPSQGSGWLIPGESIVDFILRMDEQLLRPNKTKELPLR